VPAKTVCLLLGSKASLEMLKTRHSYTGTSLTLLANCQSAPPLTLLTIPAGKGVLKKLQPAETKLKARIIINLLFP